MFQIIHFKSDTTTYDDVNCIDKSDLELSDFLLATLVDVCDCVPKSMQKVYYNPAMLATSAMLLPNFLRMFFLTKKYVLLFAAKSAKLLNPSLDIIFKDVDNTWDEISSKSFVAIDVLALVSNVAIGIAAISDYFSSPELVPYGANLCLSTHATFGIMYKPVVVSFFGAVVAVFDVVYWNSIESKPKALRRAMGHADHPENPSLDQNYIVYSCMAIVAVMYIAWLSVSLTFLPLAVPFFVIVIFSGFCIPFLAIFGMSEMLRRTEAALDKRFVSSRKGVKIDKSLFVKAILVQLISTVVLLATTASFYLDKDWTASYDKAAALVRALQYDFEFDVEFTFGWPRLPHLGEIYFVLAFSVLAFQLFVKNIIRLYYGTGANTFGTKTLQKALEQRKRGSEFEDVNAFVITSAILLLNVLSSALYVAIKMDMFVLKVSADRTFNKAKKTFEEQRKKARKVLPEARESTDKCRSDAKNVQQEILKLRSEAKDIDTKIMEQEILLIDYHRTLAEAPKTVEEVDQMLFLSQLERNAAVGGASYHGCSDISLSPVDDSDVREGICTFLVGTTMELSTSELIVELFKYDLPDLKRLGLYGVVDVIDSRALSVLLQERQARNSDFIVYTKEGDSTQIEDVLDVSLENFEEGVGDVDLSWLHMIRADIFHMRSWSSCRSINISSCKESYGTISCMLPWIRRTIHSSMKHFWAGDIRVFEYTPSIEKIYLGDTKCRGGNVLAPLSWISTLAVSFQIFCR